MKNKLLYLIAGACLYACSGIAGGAAIDPGNAPIPVAPVNAVVVPAALVMLDPYVINAHRPFVQGLEGGMKFAILAFKPKTADAINSEIALPNAIVSGGFKFAGRFIPLAGFGADGVDLISAVYRTARNHHEAKKSPQYESLLALLGELKTAEDLKRHGNTFPFQQNTLETEAFNACLPIIQDNNLTNQQITQFAAYIGMGIINYALFPKPSIMLANATWMDCLKDIIFRGIYYVNAPAAPFNLDNALTKDAARNLTSYAQSARSYFTAAEIEAIQRMHGTARLEYYSNMVTAKDDRALCLRTYLLKKELIRSLAFYWSLDYNDALKVSKKSPKRLLSKMHEKYHNAKGVVKHPKQTWRHRKDLPINIPWIIADNISVDYRGANYVPTAEDHLPKGPIGTERRLQLSSVAGYPSIPTEIDLLNEQIQASIKNMGKENRLPFRTFELR